MTIESAARNLWVIILAGGDGTRLSGLTRQLYGRALPKQFAIIAGGRSLLQDTMRRFQPVAPASRTVVIVPSEYVSLTRKQLADHEGVHVVAQPANRGTGPGILLPLAYVLARDPAARVVLAPSDHYVPNRVPFLGAIAEAVANLDRIPVTLLGVRADHPETDYGWIVPGRVLSGNLRKVARFVEKPRPLEAEQLHASGALWNTFVTVGVGHKLWAAAARCLPDHATTIRSHVSSDGVDYRALARAYACMGSSNFSREVLERIDGLAVACVEGSGWTDWGTPERVLQSLHGGPEFEELVSRMARPEEDRGLAYREGAPAQ